MGRKEPNPPAPLEAKKPSPPPAPPLIFPPLAVMTDQTYVRLVNQARQEAYDHALNCLEDDEMELIEAKWKRDGWSP